MWAARTTAIIKTMTQQPPNTEIKWLWCCCALKDKKNLDIQDPVVATGKWVVLSESTGNQTQNQPADYKKKA